MVVQLVHSSLSNHFQVIVKPQIPRSTMTPTKGKAKMYWSPAQVEVYTAEGSEWEERH